MPDPTIGVIADARKAAQATGNTDRTGSEECADAAMRVLLEHLLDFSGPARFNDVEIDAQYVEGLMKQLDPDYRGVWDEEGDR